MIGTAALIVILFVYNINQSIAKQSDSEVIIPENGLSMSNVRESD
jgi:hypothetical protein